MKNKKLTYNDKLCFAYDFLKVQKKYKKTKLIKLLFLALEGVIVAGTLIAAFAAHLVAPAYYAAIAGSLICLPGFAIYSMAERNLICDVASGKMSYRQFKKLERTKELRHLVEYAKKLESSAGLGKTSDVVIDGEKEYDEYLQKNMKNYTKYYAKKNLNKTALKANQTSKVNAKAEEKKLDDDLSR